MSKSFSCSYIITCFLRPPSVPLALVHAYWEADAKKELDLQEISWEKELEKVGGVSDYTQVWHL